MRHNSDIQYYTLRVTLLSVVLFSLLSGACSSRKKKLDNKNLIPEKELVAILTDIYLSDGLLTLPKIHNWFTSLDSTSSYFHTIEKHGYTKKTMDKTMNYYYVKKPKNLIKIYDQVLGKLSEMESIVERESSLSDVHRENFWKGKKIYSFPDFASPDSAHFDLTLLNTGLYTFSFSSTLLPNDQSVNPRLTAYLCHPDSLETGKRKYLKTLNYIKDGQPHTYIIVIKIPDKSSFNLRGWFYDFDNLPDEREKNVTIENITITYISPAV